MATKTVGQRRAEARKELAAIRERLTGMNNQQLQGFFAGFDGDMLDRCESAVQVAQKKILAKEEKAIKKQIAKLQSKLDKVKK